MKGFIERHQDRITGVLSGFDRVLFRGTMRALNYVTGMDKFLNAQGVLYKHFSAFAQRISSKLKDHAADIAAAHNRPFQYLASSSLSKETLAKKIMMDDNIQQGLVCVFSCVESCHTGVLEERGTHPRSTDDLLLGALDADAVGAGTASRDGPGERPVAADVSRGPALHAADDVPDRGTVRANPASHRATCGPARLAQDHR